MERIKLKLTDQYHFSTLIPIRITDINYGGHAGNDSFLSLIHEARMQFLKHHGFTELEFAGVSLIMIDAAIEFRKELIYGDIIKVSVAAAQMSKIGFDVHYLIEVERDGKTVIGCKAKTGMLCYNYQLKKKVSMPEEAFKKLAGNPIK